MEKFFNVKKLFLIFELFLCFGFVIIFSGSFQKESVEIVIHCNNEVVCWSETKCLETEAIDDLFKMQKRGFGTTHNERKDLVETIISMGFSTEDALNYVFPGLKQQINDLAKRIYVSPVDAKAKFAPNNNQKFSYTNERNGAFIDKDELYNGILINLEKTNKIELNISPKTILPKTTKKELKEQTKLVSFFETDYSHSSASRKNNIHLALNAINGLKLEPNKEYSFNEITGRRTKEKGYKEANIIVNNEYVEGFGGGVCQVSTTLYNALLLADVCVLESHPHSLESSYVMAGFDAMVNYGSSDLRFVNKKPYPQYVRAYHTNNKIGVEIYSSPLPYKITRKQIILSERSLPDVVVEDKTLLVGERRYTTIPKVGRKIKSCLEYSQNGKVIFTKTLRTQTYKPVQGILIVGTKQTGEDVNNNTFSSFINGDWLCKKYFEFFRKIC